VRICRGGVAVLALARRTRGTPHSGARLSKFQVAARPAAATLAAAAMATGKTARDDAHPQFRRESMPA